MVIVFYVRQIVEIDRFCDYKWVSHEFREAKSDKANSHSQENVRYYLDLFELLLEDDRKLEQANKQDCWFSTAGNLLPDRTLTQLGLDLLKRFCIGMSNEHLSN